MRSSARPWSASAATPCTCRELGRRRARRGARGGLPRRAPARPASSSGTRSCATRSTRRSRGRAAARCTRSVARSLEDAGASAAERATHWLGAGEVVRARAALAEAAGGVRGRLRLPRRGEALRTGARSRRRRGAERFELLERLAVCAELAGDLAGSARAWREVDRRPARPRRGRAASPRPQHAIGRVLALRGSTERALAAWSAAADAFAACGRHEDAARSRLAAAQVLQSTGASGLRSPPSRRLSPSSRPAPRPTSARARARSRASCSPSSARRRKRSSRCTTALSEALVGRPSGDGRGGLPGVRVVYENAGELGPAIEAYEVAIDYCASTGIAATAAVCSACLCHVLRQRGEWRRSLALCRTLLDDPASTSGSRAIAAAVMSQIHASRGERRPARLRVIEAAPVVRQLRHLRRRDGVLLDARAPRAARGLAEAALEHCRDIIRRWEETEDRHYSLNALAWSAGLFAEHGQEETSARRARARRHRRRERQPRGARDARPRARRARAREDDAPAAVEHFRRAIDLHRRSSCRTTARSCSSAPPRPRARRAATTRRASGSPTPPPGAPPRRPAAAGGGRAPARRARLRRLDARRAQASRRGSSRSSARRRGPHEPRDRHRAVPLGAHRRHARPPLADRARLPLAPRRRAQGRRARAARARVP